MPVPAEALEMVRMIRSSGDALLRVINDVLDFSKVEAGKLEPGGRALPPASLPGRKHRAVSRRSRGKGSAPRLRAGAGVACLGSRRRNPVAAGDPEPDLERPEVHQFRRGCAFGRRGRAGSRPRIASRSRFATPASGLHRTNCLACSHPSIRRTPPSAAVTGEPAWAWRSRNGWSS